MNPKDFKFNDDAFDDIFSSAKNDKFEDIYSNENAEVVFDENFEEEFEDIFSGKSKSVNSEDDYESFANEYFKRDSRVLTPENQRPAHTSAKRNPYSYNYDKATQQRANRVSQSRFDDDISEEISSGRRSETTAIYAESSGKRVLKLLVIAILIVAVLLGGGGFLFAKSLTEKTEYVPLESNAYVASDSLVRKSGVRNILLVGVDARVGEDNNKTRSDTMMLLTVDENNHQIKLCSFLRDTYIEIPGYRWAKLNAAQSHGGTQLLVDTLEYNFGVDIDNYMLVNFDMFKTIIDSLGGIDVEVTEKEAKYINSHDHMTKAEREAFSEPIDSGENHFSGAQALWYSRIRYLDNDFMRTQRQRKVITAVLSKIKKANPVKLAGMLSEIMPMLETDLDSDELMKLGMSSPKYIFYDVLQQPVPADGTWQSARRSGQSVLLIDLEKNKQIVNDFVFNKAEQKDEAE